MAAVPGWRKYEEAREWAHTLELRNYTAWRQWVKKNERPADIPSNPYYFYFRLNTWQGWEDFLGSSYGNSNDPTKPKKWRSYN